MLREHVTKISRAQPYTTRRREEETGDGRILSSAALRCETGKAGDAEPW